MILTSWKVVNTNTSELSWFMDEPTAVILKEKLALKSLEQLYLAGKIPLRNWSFSQTYSRNLPWIITDSIQCSGGRGTRLETCRRRSSQT